MAGKSPDSDSDEYEVMTLKLTTPLADPTARVSLGNELQPVSNSSPQSQTKKEKNKVRL